MARVLLVEDHTQLAGPIARELEEVHGHSVAWAADPREAEERLAEGAFDVAVVDLLFEHLTRDFDRLRTAGGIRLGGPPLLLTGLHAAAAFRRTRPAGGLVMWTSGESNRRLHLLFAYESLGVRAFCSKSSGTGRADVLDAAVRAADAGAEHVDPVLNSYLPVPGSPSIADTLLRDDRSRSIWRALAAGHTTREEIARVTGYAARSIGNSTRAMLDELVRLDPGLRPGSRPLHDLVGFASRNWEFFLDEAVRAVHR